MSEVTRILSAMERDDPHAAEKLLPLVYAELRKLAAERLRHEKPGQTLQATALVHQAYIRLVDVRDRQHWNTRGHFFAAAAEAMRRILVEAARRKRRPKYGGDRQRVHLDESVSIPAPQEDILALNEALIKFSEQEPAKAELVKLRYFAGLSIEDAAQCLGISAATAKRHWSIARAWLFNALSEPSK